MSIDTHAIPPMTDPMGRYWDQPDQSEILIDEKHALMTLSTLKKIHEYSCSIPSGVYTGKIWRREEKWEDEQGKIRTHHMLCWFDQSEFAGRCKIEGRTILLV